MFASNKSKQKIFCHWSSAAKFSRENFLDLLHQPIFMWFLAVQAGILALMFGLVWLFTRQFASIVQPQVFFTNFTLVCTIFNFLVLQAFGNDS
jgi:hypothetical protein